MTFIKNIRFEDVWERLSKNEVQIACTRDFLAWNPVETYMGDDVNAFKAFISTEQKKGRRIFGMLSYDLGYSLFKLQAHAKDDLNLPKLFFYSFDCFLKFTNGTMQLFAPPEKLEAWGQEVQALLKRQKDSNKLPSKKTPLEFKSNMSCEAYSRSYKKIKDYIKEGDIYQINLTQRLEGHTEKAPRDLFAELSERHPGNRLAYLEGPDFEILSASPESFITISADRCIETFPIKGTRTRGKTPPEDEAQREALLHSEKEAAELNMITDLLRNDLGKISEIGSVKVLGSRLLQPLTTVWHTYSHIQGKVLKGLSSVEALLSMFPGGSITGCPKKRAMEIIDEVEPTQRGIYTGCIGWIDPDDSLDFTIAIRTLVKKGKKIFLQVGGGIVQDSKEADEYQEGFDKAKSFLGIL